jgi:hypothetical protein
MKNIYLDKSQSWDGLLLVLDSLKDNTTQTINTQYPNVLSGIAESIANSNYEMAIKFYNMSITYFYDFHEGWLYCRVYIKAATKIDYRYIEDYVYNELNSMLVRLGYRVTSEIPD